MVLGGVVVMLLLVGSYFTFFNESPALKYLRASCDEVKSSPLSKGVDSNVRLLNKLKFNLKLAEEADREKTWGLSLYIDELKDYIELKKQNEAGLMRNFQLDLALGILGDRDTGDIIDDAVEDLQKQGKIDSAQLDQKVIRLKNAYKEICEN
jgi:hypothetical protein